MNYIVDFFDLGHALILHAAPLVLIFVVAGIPMLWWLSHVCLLHPMLRKLEIKHDGLLRSRTNTVRMGTDTRTFVHWEIDGTSHASVDFARYFYLLPTLPLLLLGIASVLLTMFSQPPSSSTSIFAWGPPEEWGKGMLSGLYNIYLVVASQLSGLAWTVGNAKWFALAAAVTLLCVLLINPVWVANQSLYSGAFIRARNSPGWSWRVREWESLSPKAERTKGERLLYAVNVFVGWWRMLIAAGLVLMVMRALDV